MKNRKPTKKLKSATTGKNLIARFDAGLTVLDYFDLGTAQRPSWDSIKRKPFSK